MLYDRGQVNGIPQLKILTGDEARELEPELSKAVTSALHVPTAGIICPYDLTIAAAGNAMDNGAQLVCNFEITAIAYAEGVFTLTAADLQEDEE